MNSLTSEGLFRTHWKMTKMTKRWALSVTPNPTLPVAPWSTYGFHPYSYLATETVLIMCIKFIYVLETPSGTFTDAIPNSIIYTRTFSEKINSWQHLISRRRKPSEISRKNSSKIVGKDCKRTWDKSSIWWCKPIHPYLQNLTKSKWYCSCLFSRKIRIWDIKHWDRTLVEVFSLTNDRNYFKNDEDLVIMTLRRN